MLERAVALQTARSYLFVPGHRPDRFDKAVGAGADAVIIDLEDAVPPEDKAAARNALAAWLSPGRPVLVRINGAGSEAFEEDLRLCSMPGVAGIVLPKAGTHDGAILNRCVAAGMAIFPLIETAQGVWHARALAGTPGVQRLMFGSIDLQVDLDMDADEDDLLYFRSHLVLVSRLAGLPSPVDGVSTVIDDEEQLRADTLRARRLGFGAKLCIHPRQVGCVHAALSPSDQDLAWATRIVAAADAARQGAVAVDGKMADLPVIRKAQRILSSSRS